MTADDTPNPPPGKVALTARFEGFSVTAGVVLHSEGHPDKTLLVSIRLRDGRLVALAYDAVTRQPIHDLSPLTQHLTRYMADITGELVEITTDPDYFVETLDPTAEVPPTWFPTDPEPGEGRVN